MQIHKRTLHHLWVKIRPLNYWLFLIIAISSGLVAIFALRENNIRAIELRNQVLKVDEQNGDTEAALRELREYVHSHMNTNLASGPNAIRPPIQLKYTYERLLRDEKARVSKINEKVYTDAQAACEAAIPRGTIASRIPCVEEYVGKNTVKERPIPDALYKFDFTPPAWSPDLAGWSIVVSMASFVLFGVRIGLDLWFRHHLKQHA